MKVFEAKLLNITTDLEGLSLRALGEHYKLYQGYVKKANEIRERIETVEKSDANATFSLIGDLKRQESFAINGMKLHELYFDFLGGDGVPEGEFPDKIVESYGSIEDWKQDLIAAGISARGWALVCYSPEDNEVRNYSLDAHNIGVVANTKPIIALDVYEHAYFMDYGTDRKTYISNYLRNLDWGKINLYFKSN